ncbi:hypothetical protein [Pedobacter sp. SYP-B3415]|uniref:hypothetical protein n=1 Tax=Pedobacter sp. SYP-B3415 TaxID=2496641 RepID=UPI00101C7389|nr:hypothetical protein [Pedobacter sp. SYP-B3415]
MMSIRVRRLSYGALLKTAVLVLPLFFGGCAKKVFEDLLPDTLHHVPADALFKGLQPDRSCNPFYVKISAGKQKDDCYLLLARNRRHEQILFLSRNGQLEKRSLTQLGFGGRERIAYVKETSRFPAGAGIPQGGGGAVIVSSLGHVRWVYYGRGWQIVSPD